MAATHALRVALNQGISSGNLVDTKIILYSHRDSSGRVCRPKTLYSNSHVLKTVPYFRNREPAVSLANTYAESHSIVFKVLFGNFAESKPKDFNKEVIDEEESAEDYGYLSDSDLEDDEDEKDALFEHTNKSKVHSSDPFAIPGEDNVACDEVGGRVNKGKIVKIPDMAFVTWVHATVNISNISLTLLQVSSVFDVSLHECDRVRTIWV